MAWGTIELETEVRDWLEALPTASFAGAAFYIDLLAEQGPFLGEPYTRQVDGKLRELRFHLVGRSVRVTYWIAIGRRIILLTVFYKSRMRESREIDRARRALTRCQDENTASTTARSDEMTSQDWSELRDRRMAEPGADDAYEAARLAFALGAEVRRLREARGWSQAQLARASKMTQSAVARFEAGGTIPTLPVLQRLARTLDADLIVRVAPHSDVA